MVELTWTQFLVVLGLIIAAILFAMFWHNPRRTAITVSLIFSTARHAHRTWRKIRGKNHLPEPPPPVKPTKSYGTISDYLDPEIRERIARLSGRMKKQDDDE